MDHIIKAIIEEAQSRPHKIISINLFEIQVEISRIILRLSDYIRGIEDLDISEEQKRVFIKSLLDRPIY